MTTAVSSGAVARDAASLDDLPLRIKHAHPGFFPRARRRRRYVSDDALPVRSRNDLVLVAVVTRDKMASTSRSRTAARSNRRQIPSLGRKGRRRANLLPLPCVQGDVPLFFARLPKRLFLVVMLAGSALITASSLAYFDFDTLPPFVIEKLPVRFESLWLASLRIHVAAASITFPLCIMLMTRPLQKRVAWHRWLGRLTGMLVLFALVPSGVVLAFDAKGGKVVTAGFLISATIVAGSVVRGVQAARLRDLVSHSRAMRHVLGQMSVAVVSRAMILGFDAVGIDPGVSYVVALWGPVLASVAVVEFISLRSGFSARTAVQFSERIRREGSPLALSVRVRSLVRPFARLGR